jgi:putative ABC transport system permease protein
MNRRKRMLNDLDQDIRDHIEVETQDNITRGMSPEEARYAALRKFGNVTRVKEETREVCSFVWLEQLLQDICLGFRKLRKSPGFTAVAILTLALGIGANTAIFSVINAVLLSPLPYKNPKQPVVMKENDSLPDVMDIQRQVRALSQGGGINVEKMDYTGETEPVQVRVGLINAGFLETLGVQPILGRIISPEEDVQGGPRLAMVSIHFWQTTLAAIHMRWATRFNWAETLIR